MADFKFTNRWPDIAKQAEGAGAQSRLGGGFGGFQREIVDRLDQRDTELEDFLAGSNLATFVGTTGSWTANEATITATVPRSATAVMYIFKVTGGTEGGIFTVFTDSASDTFVIDGEGEGAVTITVLTGRSAGGAVSIPVRRLNSAGVLSLVGGAL